MLTLASLSRAELGARLARPGLRLQTGRFVTRVSSPIAGVADGIALLYPDYPLLEQDGFADFYVHFTRSGGLRRWFRPQVNFDYDGVTPFDPLPCHHAQPMFEWVLNWCVTTRAHQYLMLHAAVIERNGVAAILPAPPGSGKSTLCAALVTRGWRLLSDEVALVRLDSGELEPLPRPVSLKNASIALMRAYAPQATFSVPVLDTAKGAVAHMKAPADSVRRADETARPAWIVFPRYVAGAAAQLAAVAPARAAMRVAENSFNYSLLAATGFGALARLIDATACYDFTYSALDDAIGVFDALSAS
ncbi:MAG: HprK-related kinase A [Pseudomonadota bacterium]|nr:HprK-related kinase A [Pseudomonadota bacterium]